MSKDHADALDGGHVSLLRRTINAFPRGRTVEELMALVGVTFCHESRMAFLNELDSLMRQGVVTRRKDGRWIPVGAQSVEAVSGSIRIGDSEAIFAAPFVKTDFDAPDATEVEVAQRNEITPDALLRYWRSALRADPRGEITEFPDRHGIAWHLVSGFGPLVPDPGHKTVLTLDLDLLRPDFRTALQRREANENALAIGWPISVRHDRGGSTIQPVGLLSAQWRRHRGNLIVEVAVDDVLVNPAWIKSTVRSSAWAASELAEVFRKSDGVGLDVEDFLYRLRDAAARDIRGKISGAVLAPKLELAERGLFDAAALFLPDDTSFTIGAVRDLDKIAEWPLSRLSETALAPLLDLQWQADSAHVPSINATTLNGEQLDALRLACRAPLTVVTGPPGTGKSQAIVSMAASLLMQGGTVLVASKNHQALDAVEDRLEMLAKDVPFIVRTLNPLHETDRSMLSVLKELATNGYAPEMPVDQELISRLCEDAAFRDAEFEKAQERERIECDIASVLERIGVRKQREQVNSAPDLSNASYSSSFWTVLFGRMLRLFSRLLGSSRDSSDPSLPSGQSALSVLFLELEELRAARNRLVSNTNLVELSNRVSALAKEAMLPVLTHRASTSVVDRQEFDDAAAELDFSGDRNLPGNVARKILNVRPLWLASVLGLPKRVPLEPRLFDLVIFDEASQCDIASSIPLFARAQRAVVVGDDRQLNFVPQVGRAQDRNLMQAQGLPISKMSRHAQSRLSLFEFAQRIPTAKHVMLRSQYRSAPPIVDYVSRNFYGGGLKAAYDPEKIHPPKGMTPGLAWTDIPGPASMKPNNVNAPEVHAIATHLERLLVKEGYEGTVGAIAPFRGQAHAIADAVRARLPSHKLEAADFKAATVDGFQGQERDLILFSPTLGSSSPSTAESFVQKDPRRLNVAISRARAVAHVFGDLEYARSARIRSLATLAASATEGIADRVGSPFDSHWERVVFGKLKERGLEPIPQYEIAGRRLDFALFGEGDIKLDLEIDGRQFHQNVDGARKRTDLWRDHQLRSVGWRICRFWVDQLARDMEGCLDRVEQDLK